MHEKGGQDIPPPEFEFLASRVLRVRPYGKLVTKVNLIDKNICDLKHLGQFKDTSAIPYAKSTQQPIKVLTGWKHKEPFGLIRCGMKSDRLSAKSKSFKKYIWVVQNNIDVFTWTCPVTSTRCLGGPSTHTGSTNSPVPRVPKTDGAMFVDNITSATLSSCPKSDFSSNGIDSRRIRVTFHMVRRLTYTTETDGLQNQAKSQPSGKSF